MKPIFVSEDELRNKLGYVGASMKGHYKLLHLRQEMQEKSVKIPEPWEKRKQVKDDEHPLEFYVCPYCTSKATPLMLSGSFDPDAMHLVSCPWIYRQYFKIKEQQNG